MVLDEVGSERAAILAEIDTSPAAICFAATRPERTSALILMHASAKYVAGDDYPIGIPARMPRRSWPRSTSCGAPTPWPRCMCPAELVTSAFRRWWAKLLRTGASPQTASRALLRTVLEVDLRPLLPLIQAPTLVLHRREFHVPPVEHAHFLVEHIPLARLLELPGADMSVIWDSPEFALDAIEEFLTGRPARSRAQAGVGHRVCSPTSWAPPSGPLGWRIVAGESC